MSDIGGTLMTEGLASASAGPSGTAGGTAGGMDAPAGQALAPDSGTDPGRPANTLLSGLARAGGDTPQDGQGTAPDPAAGVPQNPADYSFQFAEGVAVDTELLDAFRGRAAELGLRQDQAQHLAAFYAENAERAARQAEAAQVNALLEARRQWEGEIKQRPTFDVDKARIMTVLKRFGSDQLYDLLDQSNLGSNPEFFTFLANVGKALAEPTFRTGDMAPQPRSAAETLYPNMAPR